MNRTRTRSRRPCVFESSTAARSSPSRPAPRASRKSFARRSHAARIAPSTSPAITSPPPMRPRRHELLRPHSRTRPCDLVFTGLQSDDQGSGQVGVMLAELAGAPHASIVMAIEVSGTTLRVKRELEGGWSQWLTLPLPAVLTIQSGINQLRYATLKGIMGAKKKDIRTVSSPSRGVSSAHRPFIRAGTWQENGDVRRTASLGRGGARARPSRSRSGDLRRL